MRSSVVWGPNNGDSDLLGWEAGTGAMEGSGGLAGDTRDGASIHIDTRMPPWGLEGPRITAGGRVTESEEYVSVDPPC